MLDPYFSATKIAWILDHVPGARPRANGGELAAGTVDTLLIWHLTGGREHLTDVTNASRTLLMDLETGQFADELCEVFEVPPGILPEIRPSAGDFGVTRGLDYLPDGIPITGVAGDQQASLVGQGCVEPGPGQVHLWHGGLPAGPHRRRRRALDAGADHDPGRLAGRRARPVRPGGERLHRRGGRPVVPRRPEGHRRGPGDRRPGPRGRSGQRGDLRSRPDRPGGAPLGPRGPRDDLRPHPSHEPGRRGQGHARRASASRSPT